MAGKKKFSGLGRTILRAKQKENMQRVYSDRHIDDNNQMGEKRLKLQSIIEENDLNEFMNYAILQNREFSAEHDTVTFVVDELPKVFNLDDQGKALLEAQRKHVQLPIPRRPKWKSNMTRTELQELEKASFLNWRRSLSSSETNTTLSVTPYEKNLDVWRQLWRVVERGHLIVQIVDCRNPLMFRSEDLERYIKEVDPAKQYILLMNKADLLTRKQRFQWANYLRKRGVRTLFFSAFREQQVIDSKEEVILDFDHVDTTNYGMQKQIYKITTLVEPDKEDWTHVYTREELLCFFKSLIETLPKQTLPVPQIPKINSNKKASKEEVEEEEDNDSDNDDKASISMPQHPHIVVSFVGYPNVGKSSLINVLCGKKRVAVAPTPGKTKHFQTIFIGKNIIVADCPGLVFPSATTTKEDMVCDGVLPIDQMKEYRAPIALVCQRIPRKIFEMIYGVKFPKRILKEQETGVEDNSPLGVEELLYTYARSRSMMSQKGIPNAPHVARIILKDYVAGKLLFCHAPPPEEGELETKKEQPEQQAKQDNTEEIINEEDIVEDDGDEEYFTESEEEEQVNVEDDDDDEEMDLGNPEQKPDLFVEGAEFEKKQSKLKTTVDYKFNENNVNMEELEAKEAKKKHNPNQPPVKLEYYYDPDEEVVIEAGVSSKSKSKPVHTMPAIPAHSPVMQLLNAQVANRDELIDRLRQDNSKLSKEEQKALKMLKRKTTYMKKFK